MSEKVINQLNASIQNFLENAEENEKKLRYNIKRVLKSQLSRKLSKYTYKPTKSDAEAAALATVLLPMVDFIFATETTNQYNKNIQKRIKEPLNQIESSLKYFDLVNYGDAFECFQDCMIDHLLANNKWRQRLIEQEKIIVGRPKIVEGKEIHKGIIMGYYDENGKYISLNSEETKKEN